MLGLVGAREQGGRRKVEGDDTHQAKLTKGAGVLPMPLCPLSLVPFPGLAEGVHRTCRSSRSQCQHLHGPQGAGHLQHRPPQSRRAHPRPRGAKEIRLGQLGCHRARHPRAGSGANIGHMFRSHTNPDLSRSVQWPPYILSPLLSSHQPNGMRKLTISETK